MKKFFILAFTLCALTAQAQTDNVRRNKPTTPAAKPTTAKPAAKPKPATPTKPAANPRHATPTKIMVNPKPVAEPAEPAAIPAPPKKEVPDITAEKEDKVYNVVEQPPMFPGGETALLKYVADHLEYPKEAKELGIQGRVILSFIVMEDGSVGEVQVSKGLESHCDQEAVRVVKSLPKFIPGKQQGKPVKVRFTLPVSFK